MSAAAHLAALGLAAAGAVLVPLVGAATAHWRHGVAAGLDLLLAAALLLLATAPDAGRLVLVGLLVALRGVAGLQSGPVRDRREG